MQVPGYILKHTNIKDEKILHFYLLLIGFASIYTVMNVSVVLFLNEALGSIFLAGLALAIGSIFSLLFDGLFSYLQKIFTSRTLFLWSIVGMIIAVFFFIISFYPIIAFIAAIFFRISFDLCDITAISYVLSKSLPAEYGQNLSYKQLAQGIGMILGFIVSAILISTSYFIGDTATTIIDNASSIVNIQTQSEKFISALLLMKLFLLILLFGLWFMAFLLFDKEVKNFSKEFLKSSFQKLESDTTEGLKHTAIIIKKNIPEILSKEKNQIELKSTENKQVFNLNKIFSELTTDFKNLIFSFTKRPKNKSLIWSIWIMGIFSYWDTFLATFLPIFFTEVLRAQSGFIKNIPGSLLMLMFILPVLGFLPMIAKLGDKYGRYYFMFFGIIITALSCFLIGLVKTTSLFLIIIGGYGISIGYLFGMSSAKAQAAEKFNEFLAVEKQQAEIDSNASAGPIMLIDNIGNIIGPLLGGGLIAILGFQNFFLFFGCYMLFVIFISIKERKGITGHSYIFQSPIKDITFQTSNIKIEN